jgi:cytochrome c peroxidase
MASRSTIALLVAASSFYMLAACSAVRADRWAPAQLEDLRGLWIGSLEPLPPDPTNRFADDPRAAALGRRLFFEPRLSGDGRVSCGTCHQPELGFQDGIPLGRGVGVTTRRTMPIAGSAYSPFLFWDGRKDSLWAQALGPLESPVEHGGTREHYAGVVAQHYRTEYEHVFGPLPVKRDGESTTQVFVNIGKAIAAYERRVRHKPSRFDAYVDALVTTGREPRDVLTEEEIAGAKLFVGKGGCTQCHNGPLFTNQEFHNTGVPAAANLPVDRGRATGTHGVLADEFNCRSRWSDARGNCAELDYMVKSGHELERAFKVPSLRDVAERAPYMHAGQLATLSDVLAHYNHAPAAPAGHTEIKPLRLNARELRQLEVFLRTLSGGTIVRSADSELRSHSPSADSGATNSTAPGIPCAFNECWTSGRTIRPRPWRQSPSVPQIATSPSNATTT